MLLATSFWVSPTMPALERSTLTSQLGPIDHLVDVHVGGAGNAATSDRRSAGDLVIGGGIAAHHLHIDRRGQAEIQNLVGDVGGFEEDGDIGEFLVQALAQAIGVVGGGTVLFGIERDEDIAIAGADRGAVAEGQIEAAVGDADVVDDVFDFARRE